MRQLVIVLLVIGVLSLCSRALAGAEEIKRLVDLTHKVGRTDCDVIYGGRTFSCEFVGRFGRMFLAMHYNGETAEQWIDKWCYRSLGGSIVWVRENKKYQIASKRLKEELKNQHDRTRK